MKKAFVYGLLAALAITGCQAELEVLNPENNTEPEVITQEPSKVFTAIVDEDFNSETKTSLDGSGNVLWKMGDQVSIFAASTVNEQYQVTDASDGKTAATLNKIPSGGFVAGTDIDNNVAFYPYASTAEIAKSGSNYVISEIELPATQTYAAGSFGNGAFPMATVTSSTEDMNLKFKNVLGGLKLQLKGTSTITSITVTGNNNEILCGDAEVTTTYGGVPSIVLTDASAKTVTLDCGAGVTLDSETATPFIIALPPMTMTGGFTVVVADTEGKQMEIKTTKPQTITRSNLLKMPAVNYVGENLLVSPLKFTSTGATSISLTKTGSPDSISLECKLDDGEWTSYTVGNTIDLTDGQEVSFRAGASGNASFSQSSTNYYKFSVTGSGTVSASGNLMSLLNRAGGLIIPNSHCFYRLFLGCGKLTTAPELPATTLTGSCYANMFSNCSGLTTVPELPATILANGCYSGMFTGCTSLTTTPELPATTLAADCYYYMFNGCTSLATAPELPATTLAVNCYYYMFNGCTSLAAAPELPATTLAEACYECMFHNCTGLTTVPSELPATTLAAYCYHSMFSGCASLATAPELPATILANGCYYMMFSGCTNLTTAPELPATTLVNNCYSYLFYNCTQLNHIKALFTTTPSYSYTNSWVSGVAATGTFVKNSSATWDVTGIDGVPSGWTIETESQPFTITSTGTTSIAINKSGTPDNVVLEYKKGDGEWTSYTIGNSIDLTDGQTLQFRAGVSGNDKFSSDYANYYYVVASGLGTINVSGNIMSLLDRSLERTTLTSAIFNHLFKDCSKLVDASNLVLPATTLAADCYYWMFSRCTSLTTAPALPATTLADNCYESMFLECSSLTTAPALPATTLAKECYCDMFSDCTSLTTAPALPATTMRTGCYSYMFRHCTSLTTAPALPATTLAKECYDAMFIGCSNLNYIKALFTTTPSSSYTDLWVSGVAATGTFVKSSSASWNVTGDSGVPSGWTIQTE